MNSIKTLSVALLLLVSLLANSQTRTFSGQVVSRDEQPIPYAHVALQNKLVGTISDINGYFTLTVPESEIAEQSVVISSIGFQPVTLSSAASWDKVIQLVPSINELDEVVVTSTKFKESAKDLVNAALKKASKIRKDLPIELNVEQRQYHKGILTKYYINNEVKVTRKQTSNYSEVIPTGTIEHAMDISSLQPSSFILTPEKVLTNDLYTQPKLNNSKGKYYFQFTDVAEIRGQEAVVVTVSQNEDLNIRNYTFRNDYKFYFSASDLRLLRYERNEQTKFGEGFNEIHRIEHTVCDYDPTQSGDPILAIESDFEQFTSYLDRDGKVIHVVNKREHTSGHRDKTYSRQDSDPSKRTYSSAKKALERNTQEDKLYLFVFWEEYGDMTDTYHDPLYDLIRTYTFSELEVLCITTSKNSELQWKDISSSYALFDHYRILGETDLRPITSKKVFLYRKGELLSSANKISEDILKAIDQEVKGATK